MVLSAEISYVPITSDQLSPLNWTVEVLMNIFWNFP